jgi:signal transduction histidine kinase
MEVSTISPSTDARQPDLRYLDGGQSKTIRQSLEPLLAEVAEQLQADVCLALYESFSSARETRMLAAVAAPSVGLPLPNEPLVIEAGASGFQPSAVDDLVLSSAVRRYRLELTSAIVLPWRDASGRGWLVAGQLPSSWNAGTLDLATASDFVSRLRETHRVASLEGALRLYGDVSKAARFVNEVAVDATNMGEILEAIVRGARTLLGTDVAYVSLPDAERDAFVFTTLLNIHTTPFRRLRMRVGQGLGGLTAEEMCTVRSFNYAEDGRLRQAPRRETIDEGIVSAMCTPLVIDGDIEALLYVGNRKLTPFTRTDVSLIEQFAEHATINIRRAQLESYRHSLLQRRERERLAGQLHDSVVRALLEIGFQANEAMVLPSDSEVRHRFSIIGRAAESCLEQLRDSLSNLADEPAREAGSLTVGEIFESLRSIRWRPVEAKFEVQGVPMTHVLPAGAARMVLRVAREAIDNAQLHSGCTEHRMTLEVDNGSVRVVIRDNGCGLTGDQIDQMLMENRGHLGLRGMRAAARRAGGTLRIFPADDGGLTVEAVMPLAGGTV